MKKVKEEEVLNQNAVYSGIVIAGDIVEQGNHKSNSIKLTINGQIREVEEGEGVKYKGIAYVSYFNDTNEVEVYDNIEEVEWKKGYKELLVLIEFEGGDKE